MKISNLKYPPLKSAFPKKKPSFLVFHSIINDKFQPIDQFVMISTKPKDKGKYNIMQCFPEFIYRDKYFMEKSLYIYGLNSYPMCSGLGTQMLDFARIYSKRIGCNGKFHLIADQNRMKNKISHVFYRKYGMNTGKYDIDKALKQKVKKHQNATSDEFKEAIMYYPPIKSDKQPGFFRRFLDIFFDE